MNNSETVLLARVPHVSTDRVYHRQGPDGTLCGLGDERRCRALTFGELKDRFPSVRPCESCFDDVERDFSPTECPLCGSKVGQLPNHITDTHSQEAAD